MRWSGRFKDFLCNREREAMSFEDTLFLQIIGKIQSDSVDIKLILNDFLVRPELELRKKINILLN